MSTFSASDQQTLKSAEILKKEGNSLAGRREFKDAAVKYNKVLTLIGERPEAEFVDICKSCSLNLAHCLLGVADFETCVDVTTAFIDKHGDHFKAYYRRGKAHKEMMNFAEAKEDLELAVELAPGEDEAISAALAEVTQEYDGVFKSDMMQKAQALAANMTEDQKREIKEALAKMSPEEKKAIIEQLQNATPEMQQKAIEDMEALSPGQLAAQATNLKENQKLQKERKTLNDAKQALAQQNNPQPPQVIPEEVKNFNFIYAFPEKEIFDKAKADFKANADSEEKKGMCMNALRNRGCALILKGNLFQTAQPFIMDAKMQNKCPPERWNNFIEAKKQLDGEANAIAEEAKAIVENWNILAECQQIVQKRHTPPPPNPALESFNFIFAFPLKAKFDHFKGLRAADAENVKLQQECEGVLRERTCDGLVKNAIFNQAAPYILFQKQTGKPVTDERWTAFQHAKRQIEAEMNEILKEADALKENWGTSKAIFKEMDEHLKKNPPQMRGQAPNPNNIPPELKNFDYDAGIPDFENAPEAKAYEVAKAAFDENKTDETLQKAAGQALANRCIKFLQHIMAFKMAAQHTAMLKQKGEVSDEKWESVKRAEGRLNTESALIKAQADQVKEGWGASDGIFKECDAILRAHTQKLIQEGKLKVPGQQPQGPPESKEARQPDAQ